MNDDMIMCQDIKATEYIVFEIGKTIKSSKLMYKWAFYYKTLPHELRLYVSKVSQKKMLVFDERILLPKQKFTEKLTITFQLGNNAFSIEQIGGEFIVNINSISFTHLLGTMYNPKPLYMQNAKIYGSGYPKKILRSTQSIDQMNNQVNQKNDHYYENDYDYDYGNQNTNEDSYPNNCNHFDFGKLSDNDDKDNQMYKISKKMDCNSNCKYNCIHKRNAYNNDDDEDCI